MRMIDRQDKCRLSRGGQLTVSNPAAPHQVHAWVLWEDGVEELVHGLCGASVTASGFQRPAATAEDVPYAS